MFVQNFLRWLLHFSMFLCATSGLAQEVDLFKIHEELESFSIELAERLGFRDGAALFGMNRGTVSAVYLYGQGILVEVRTPLANERNRLQLTSLKTAIRTLEIENPFERFLLQNASDGFNQTNNSDADNFYQTILDRIDTIDSTLTFSRAIQQASDSVRLLRELDDITETEYVGLRSELQSLQARMDEHNLALKKLEEDAQLLSVRDGNEFDYKVEGSTTAESYFEENLNTVIESIEPLAQLAARKAEYLLRRAESAEESYLRAWQGKVFEFELSLFELVCNFKSFSYSLPLSEYLTFVLKGIGDGSVGVGANSDKLHVLSKSDIEKCQNGNIGAIELLELARQYSM